MSVQNSSWDQAGNYDVPAMIDHVLKVTGQNKIQYVGHSMGTTGLMVALNEHPDIAKKIKLAHFLAPVAHVKIVRSPLALLIQPAQTLIEVGILTF